MYHFSVCIDSYIYYLWHCIEIPSFNSESKLETRVKISIKFLLLNNNKGLKEYLVGVSTLISHRNL